jgi:hypothetical protein
MTPRLVQVSPLVEIERGPLPYGELAGRLGAAPARHEIKPDCENIDFQDCLAPRVRSSAASGTGS